MSKARPAPQAPQVQKADNDLVLSFLSVRRAIGILGFFLPAALIVYGLVSGTGILGSMSAFYYTPMREIFVGTLCAQAVFLWSYEGYRPLAGEVLSDRVMAQVASLGALAIALAPTGPDLPEAAPGETVPAGAGGACTLLQCLLGTDLASTVHFIGAAMFFLALAAFCLALFTRGRETSPEKRGSNRIYRLCGTLILLSLGGIGLVSFTPLGAALSGYSPVFWLEVVATLAFATSWLVKGDALRPLVRASARAL